MTQDVDMQILLHYLLKKAFQPSTYKSVDGRDHIFLSNIGFERNNSEGPFGQGPEKPQSVNRGDPSNVM